MANQKNNEVAIRNLETQVRQIAKQLADRQSGQFSANTQTNPKEYCNLITTRSGIVVGEGAEGERKYENENEKMKARRKKKMKVKIKSKSKRVKTKRGVPLRNLPYSHAPSRRDKRGNLLELNRFLKIGRLIFNL